MMNNGNDKESENFHILVLNPTITYRFDLRTMGFYIKSEMTNNFFKVFPIIHVTLLWIIPWWSTVILNIIIWIKVKNFIKHSVTSRRSECSESKIDKMMFYVVSGYIMGTGLDMILQANALLKFYDLGLQEDPKKMRVVYLFLDLLFSLQAILSFYIYGKDMKSKRSKSNSMISLNSSQTTVNYN